MTMQHTPGPWTANCGESYYVAGPDMNRVAMMMRAKGPFGVAGRPSEEEAAANCQFIAAAPDMLAALRAVMDPETHWAEARKQVLTAIAKATGEST